MPKVSSSKADLLKKWIKNAKHLSTNGTVVYCNACSKQVYLNFRSINTLLQPFTRKWRNDLTGKCNKRLFQLYYGAAPNKTRILEMNFILIYATPCRNQTYHDIN
ncbi:unnamed protein product [Acanthoscelides obtectus]|uniref:Uncharacterized protein n=1 Tax=Acanthoscelides obtectus TaxID=200917 RepID=A0A9P0LZ66_ACAOB|nr:unnamed protein product [Acanthoscelides obtectus]CAK1643599.1 hypothetical protein AOBTE_LOCUS13596 [Acanthoscelides obtectus]